MSLEAELIAAHRVRRAAWSAKAVPDTEISLRRPNRRGPINAMPWVAPVDVWAAKPAPVVKTIPIVCLDKPRKVIITRSKGVLTVPGILRFVGRRYKVPVAKLMARGRDPYVVHVRNIAIHVAWKITLRSLPDLGRRIGGRDHSTILYALRKAEELIAVDPRYAARMVAIEDAIRAKAAKAAA